MKEATPKIRSFLALCAGPLLLALAASGAAIDVASSLQDSCDYGIYMCCWTGMEDNTDVCRVKDYPSAGVDLELPREEEGPVYCHGFGFDSDTDVSTNILPLYEYVTNLGAGGNFGTVEGAPQCGCLEDMPIVSQAACSRIKDGETEVEPCLYNSLRHYYNRDLDQFNGPLEFSLAYGSECDNWDVPEFDFHSCDYNTYMCCFTKNNILGMNDNTDVCRYGESEYPGDSEGDVHCHGFVWAEDASDWYINQLAYHVQHVSHRDRRGYYESIPGAPLCACIEDMPQVSAASCTTHDEFEDGDFDNCVNDNLRKRYDVLFPDGTLSNLRDCDNEDGEVVEDDDDDYTDETGPCEGIGKMNKGATVCCPGGCSQCGGNHCQKAGYSAGLTNHECCSSRALSANKSCDATGTAPCVI